MNKININQQYGCIDMPSQIIDSFQQHEGQSSIEKNEHSPSRIHEKYSQYIDESEYKYHRQQASDINLQSSFQDTFLANLPILLNKNANQNNKIQLVDQPQIALNKKKIVKNVLPSEEVLEFVQAINSSSSAIVLTVTSPSQIEIISTQGYQKNSDFYLTSINTRQFYLQAWQKVQIGFKIQKNSDEIGDIFQTITLQSKFKIQKHNNQVRKKRAFIQVQIHYITPKLKISYQGCSDVVTISLNKVSLNKIAKNKFGQHSIMLGLNGLQRFECTMQARGQVKVFPSQFILYKDEMKKINFKGFGKNNNGAIIIKAKNAKVNFVFGVQLI